MYGQKLKINRHVDDIKKHVMTAFFKLVLTQKNIHCINNNKNNHDSVASIV